ncbi:hypothetical protein KQ302_05940 [Synechococcus sp. CS-602]|uniref:hypothetical protein n=1 Tax=Synechococcaceae TaxID=1890426 RepID=UPI0011A6F082|nr:MULTISPECIES: hypothetical protein [Synechococcaceae]MCT0203011.1 hypothetical protein [Synechococcus sp. CS-603]MCT0204650.1 hypothetical protein [Synechococcus sp. CS-602]MCT4365043.1 hypothetical protein [Candidatus Regnicoccus frigidus MAG-AL1]MCT4367838.1 hypothetical protein [Candidatus Regnicoccus frigidus MAG-AL2]
MSQARPRRSSRRHRPAQAETPRRPRSPWLMALLAGLCFGLGYGITGRLLALGGGEQQPLGQPFEVKPTPGTSLESLRMRFGDQDSEIRGDLEKLEQDEKRKAGEAKRAQEVKERQAEAEADAASRTVAPEEPPLQRLLPDEPSTAAPSPPPRDFPSDLPDLPPPQT